MPVMTDDEAYFTLPPDWVCEVLSQNSARHDRARKLPIYGTEGVGHAWLVDPIARTLEAFRNQAGQWLLLEVFENDAKVRAEPFEVFELDLAILWADVVLGP
jgi:Uma2 family endonuclease